MDDELIKKILEDTYDVSKEDTIWSMVGDFYNRKMLSIIIFLWVWAIIFIAGAVYSSIKFFDAEQTKSQIMYASIFICLIESIAVLKIFAWQMIHRNNIKREIKRLELRIAELAEAVKDK